MKPQSMLDKTIKYIEKMLIAGILVTFSSILVFAFIDIVYEIVIAVVEPPMFVIDAERLMSLFSIFLIILIGIELLETIKIYLREDVLHVELVMLVAIIAIARKVIVWDFEKYSYLELFGLAAMVLALSAGFYLLKKIGIAIPMRRAKDDTPEP